MASNVDKVMLLLSLVVLTSGVWCHRHRRNHVEDRKDHHVGGQWRRFDAEDPQREQQQQQSNRRDFSGETLDKTKRNVEEEGSKLPFSSRRLEKMLEKAILKIITGDLSTADMLLLKSLNYSLEEVLAIRERELGRKKDEHSRKEEKRLHHDESKRKDNNKLWKQNSMEFNYPSRGNPDLDEPRQSERRDRITERIATRNNDADFDFDAYNRQAVMDYENLASKLESRQTWSESTLLDYEDQDGGGRGGGEGGEGGGGESKERKEQHSALENIHQTFDRAMEPHVVFKIRYDDSEFDSSSGSDERSKLYHGKKVASSKQHRSPIFKHSATAAPVSAANSFHDPSTSFAPVSLHTPLPVAHRLRQQQENLKASAVNGNGNSDSDKANSEEEPLEVAGAKKKAEPEVSLPTTAATTFDSLPEDRGTRNFSVEPQPVAAAVNVSSDDYQLPAELENKTNEISTGERKISEYEGLEWVEDDVYRVIPALADSLGYDNDSNDENETSDYEEATSGYRKSTFSEEADNDTFEYQNDAADSSSSVMLFMANSNNSADNVSMGNLTSYQQLALAHRRDQGQKAIEDIKSRVLALTGRFNLSTNTNQVQRERLTMFSPSCQVPRNTDEETWADPYSMNMHFMLNLTSREHVVAAKLRLYKLPQENLTSTSAGFEDEEEYEKIRISVYYYTKSLKRHRSKKRLMDSVVTPLSSEGNHLALDVRQGLRFWRQNGRSSHGTGNNHGLVVQVEDQDGRPLKPALYIQEPSCSEQNLDEKAYQRKPALFIRACARYVRIVNGETVTYVNCRH